MFGGNSAGWTLAIAAGVGVVSAYWFGQRLQPAQRQPEVREPEVQPNLVPEVPLQGQQVQAQPANGAPVLEGQGNPDLDTLSEGDEDVFEASPAALPNSQHTVDLGDAAQQEQLVEEERGVDSDPAWGLGTEQEHGVVELDIAPPRRQNAQSDDDPDPLQEVDPTVTLLDLARNPSVTQLAALGRVASDLTLERRDSTSVDAARQATEEALTRAAQGGRVKLKLF